MIDKRSRIRGRGRRAAGDVGVCIFVRDCMWKSKCKCARADKCEMRISQTCSCLVASPATAWTRRPLRSFWGSCKMGVSNLILTAGAMVAPAPECKGTLNRK